MADAIDDGWVDGRYKYQLTAPLDVMGEQISVITLRAPVAGDMFAVGNPVETYLASDHPTIRFDDKRMGDMIARLGGIPPASLAKLSTKDAIGMGWILANFFTPI